MFDIIGDVSMKGLSLSFSVASILFANWLPKTAGDLNALKPFYPMRT
jgi:hypothetical protein